MGYFPMCVDLTGNLVYLLGDGPQAQEKAARLAPFGAQLVRLAQLTEEEMQKRPAFVVAGDLDEEAAERAAALCRRHGVPINVVDMPRLCTFTFPAMIVSGDLTVSVSTGGKAPGAAAQIKARMAACIPEKTGEILDWLAHVRAGLRDACPAKRRAALMRAVTAAALDKGDALTGRELAQVMACEAAKNE